MTEVQHLAAELAAASDDALVRLLDARPDLLAGATDFAALAARALSRLSIQRSLETLDRPHLGVLESVVVLTDIGTDAGTDASTDATGITGAPDGVRLDDLAAALPGVPGPALAALVDDLLLLRLLRRDGDVVRPAGALPDALGHYPAGLGRSSRRLAAVYPAAATALRGHRPRDTPTPVDPVEPAPPAPSARPARHGGPVARLEHLLTRAPEGTAALLERFHAAPLADLRHADRLVAETDDAAARGIHPDEPVPWLLHHRLLVPLDGEHAELAREAGLAARHGAVHSALPLDPAQSDAGRAGPAVRDNAALASVTECLRLVTALHGAVERRPLTTLRAGGVGVREVRRLAQLLGVPAVTAGMILELTAIVGLIGPDEAHPEHRATAADPWFSLDRAHQWAVLAGAWRRSRRVPSRAASPRPDGGTVAPLAADAGRPDAPHARDRVLTAMADLAREHPGIVLTERVVAERIAWRWPRSAARLLPLVASVLTEAAFLGLTGAGALTAAGMDIAAGDDDGAAAALTAVLPPPVTTVLLQADLTAVAPGPLDHTAARLLAGMADREGHGPAETYRFSAASIQRALDDGRDAPALLEDLGRLSVGPLPQPLTYLIEDTAARSGRVTVGRAAGVVVVTDPAELDALLAVPRSARLGLRRLAPTVAVTDLDPDALRRDLDRLGVRSTLDTAREQPPAVDEAAPRARSVDGEDGEDGGPATEAPGAVAVVEALRRTGTGRRAPLDPETATLLDLSLIRTATQKGSAVVVVTVDAGGNQRRDVLVPLSVGGGRLRAFDPGRDAERVISLPRIVEVLPA